MSTKAASSGMSTVDAYASERKRCLRTLAVLASRSKWEPTAVTWHSRQIDRFFDDLNGLKRRNAAKPAGKLRRLRDSLLSGYSGTFCAFLQEAHVRGLKNLQPVDVSELDAHLRSCRSNRRKYEMTTALVRTKGSGEKRVILSPGRRIRVAQRLVSDVLSASEIANPYDYNSHGKGGAAAVREVIRLAEQEGVRDFVVFDLKKCFASVRAMHLQEVPLPKQVIRHSVYFNRSVPMRFKPATAYEDKKAARHGLPQGARVSGLLASSLIGRELRHLDGAQGLVIYVDDGIMGACDPAGAKSLAEAIKLRFGNLPGGPLDFKRLDCLRIEEGIDFLGYFLRLQDCGDVLRVVAKPSHQARKRFERRLRKKLSTLQATCWDAAQPLALEYAQDWRRSFPVWQPTVAEWYEFEGIVEIMVSDYLSLKSVA